MAMSIEIFDAKTMSGFTITEVAPEDTVRQLKRKISKTKQLSADRISLRLEPRAKGLADEQLVSELNLSATNPQLYYRDLGAQIAWKTVFLLEYAGPFFIYPLFYSRSSLIYGKEAAQAPISFAVTIACICHTIHYAKRLYETQFVHRFSNGTMPIRNLFKNCSYYWGFAAFIAYFVNHPLYTSPGFTQVLIGLVGFLISELGNLSIHLLLRDLRPPGSRERKIPFPNSNPLTLMYNVVSCPNYTYEVYSWIFFSVMTQCLPAILFTVAGFAQMKIWADAKHRAYKKDFAAYPRGRTPIIPFLC
uniref:very-long-chain enoyl-CoA reductase n=1 Tax=Globodera rostochiensis TaxID=31243 RepID=A0A914HFH7_GLORO